MLEFFIAMGAVSLTNLVARTIKCDIAKKKAIRMFEDNGYDVNKQFSSIILDYIKDEDEAMKIFCEMFLGVLPITNIYYLLLNIKYLCGDHSKQKYYDDLSNWENWLKDGRAGINSLIEKDVIKENKEKKEILKELDNTYESSVEFLINKYEHMEFDKQKLSNNDNKFIIFSEEDNTEELNRKLMKLQSLLAEKIEKEQDVKEIQVQSVPELKLTPSPNKES